VKIIGIASNHLTVELDTTDCIALACACGHALSADSPIDYSYLCALATTFLSAGYAAYASSNDDAPRTPARMWAWWAPLDTDSVPPARIPVPLRFVPFIGDVAEGQVAE